VLPVRVMPLDNVTLVLDYEGLLERREGRYEHVLSISPGEIVEDFGLHLKVEDWKTLKDLRLSVPAVGDISQAVVFRDEAHNQASVAFSMTEMDQHEYFGRHGFTGNVRLSFDVAVDEGDLDLALQDDHFLQFYAPAQPLESIPKHVIFLLDTSESMNGPKADHAADSLQLLLDSLSTDRDFINVLAFDEDGVFAVAPDGDNTTRKEPRRADNHTSLDIVEEARAIYKERNATTSSRVSNLTSAIQHALSLDERVWLEGHLPENAYTMVLVISDARGQGETVRVTEGICRANRIQRLPIFGVAVGFDANLELLRDVCMASGGTAAHVIEDLDVRPQLAKTVSHLDEVVLKR